MKNIDNNDIINLSNAINLVNKDFAETIMTFAEKNQIFSDKDVELLCSRDFCRVQFHSDYAILREVDISEDLNQQLKDNSGRNRYYSNVHELNNNSYVMTSQLYGLGKELTHRDNRTPFWEWVLHKVEVDEWWPPLTEYNPSLSKEQWLELLNDGTTFTDNALSAFAAMYDFGGIATCVQLENQYGKTSDFYRMTMGVHVPDKIHKKLGTPFCVEDEKEWLWPIPFVGRSAGKDEPGKYVWKLRPELYDALEEFDITRFLLNKGTEKPMPQFTTKEIIETIKNYIDYKGFTYEDGVIENFYLSLKSKPFVILAGTSGTGKSKLVELFAEAIGAEYLPVAVRPDWSDSSDLFGHLNLNGKYVKGAIFDFIYEAQVNPGKPYILCMDEMNLARVEYYLSDFLSIIETRKEVDGRITTKPLVSDANYGEDYETRGKYGELVFPENLYLVGTVNMDETTFPFSKKVLDRANTIEFDFVDLLPPKEKDIETVDSLEVSNDFLKTKYLLLNQCNDRKYVKDICVKLEDLNKELRLSNAHVGYRVRDEIAFYMLNNKEEGLLSEDDAFDYEIMQKILPRIQGSASSIKNMLFKLYEYCYGTQSGINVDEKDAGKTMRSLASNAKYKLSAAKIGFMMERYKEDGFTSYWL